MPAEGHPDARFRQCRGLRDLRYRQPRGVDPVEPESVDTVLVTYTLCTIPDAIAALEGMRRVLKHSGRLIFCEHGKAPDEAVRRWQDRLNPLWRRGGGGRNLKRDIPALIEAAGFRIDNLQTMYLPGTPRFAGFNYRVSARRR